MPRRLNALHRILAKLPWIPSEPPAMARSSILVQRPRERNAGPDRKKGGPSSPPGPVVTRSSVCERADAVLTLTKLVMISVALGRSAVSNCLTSASIFSTRLDWVATSVVALLRCPASPRHWLTVQLASLTYPMQIFSFWRSDYIRYRTASGCARF